MSRTAWFSMLVMASLASAASAQVMEWVPVSSTGPHTIVGNTITVADSCAQQVTLEARLSGWTPQLLQAYQVTVDSTGYSSGTGLPLNPLGWPADQALGAFVDEDHPDYVFSGLDGLSAESTVTLDYRWLAVVLNSADSRVDDGGTFYGGTLILEVPAGAAGSYTISIDPDPNLTLWTSDAGANIGPATLVPAVVTVSGSSLCCSSADCDDGNACTIDTCDTNTGMCAHNSNPCDDGDPCTDDSCDTAAGQCVNDAHPCASDVDCPIEGICANGVCECGCSNDAQCDDGFFCTGAETCDTATGSCASSGNPCAGTGLPACDEAIDSCIVAVPTIQWLPVASTGPHTIDGNNITVADNCSQQVTMEIRFSGWTPHLLAAYQVTVDSTGYSSGTGVALNPLGWPANQALGAFVDEDHPDFVFSGLDGVSAENTATLDYAWFAALFNSADSRVDDGGTFYGGTLILEVPAGAAGSYTISIDPDPNVTLWTTGAGAVIGPLTFVPAVVTVSGSTLCCNSADCDDGDACTIDTCDPDTGVCAHDPDPCDDGKPCTDDSCDTAAGQCVNDPHPCASDVDCPIEGICVNGVCDCGCTNDAQCDDGFFCTGAETCNTATGSCASSGDPCAGTALPVCDETIDSCIAAIPTIQWVPVSSTGPHAIVDNTITVTENCPQQVTLEARLSGWTPQLLQAYQVTVDSTGYSSGTGLPLNPLGWPADQALGAFVDEDHPDYVFSGLDGLSAENISTLDYSWLAVVQAPADSRVDDGGTFYGGTLILEVPARAAGSYTISIDPDPNLTLWTNENSANIGPLTLVPAVVTVSGSSLCCSSADCEDGNACTIDTCDTGTGVCVHDPNPCDDGNPCTDDSCDTAAGQCVNDAHPCASDVDCPIEGICANGVCDCGCSSDSECDDGFFCTGAETCDTATGSCASSGNPCTGTALAVCDEEIDGCIAAIPTIQWVPVSSTGPHAIVDNTITVADNCPQQVTLEARLSGWTPQLLQAYQVTVDSTGYSSGTGVALNPLGWPADPALGAFVDEDHPDYLFSGLDGLSAKNISTLGYSWLAVVLNSADSRVDDGGTFYGGTLILEVPTGATGSYTISIDPDPNLTLWTDDVGANIGPLTLVPAAITVSPSLCCTSADCDDGDACTIDSCVPDTGVCAHDPNFNVATQCCDPATGVVVIIDDGVPCTDDLCDAATGTVSHSFAPEGTVCDDSDLCTTDDVCLAGLCSGQDINEILCEVDPVCPPPGTCVNGVCDCGGVGACCFGEICGDGFAAADCTTVGGIPQGANTICANMTCEVLMVIPKLPGVIGGIDHDIRKNRFISIDPTTNVVPVSLKVELLDLACLVTGQKCNNAADCKICDANSDNAGAACTIRSDCSNGNCVVSGETCDQQSAPVMLGWVGNPVEAGNSAPIGTFVSLVVNTPPPARAWTESVVHIMGCQIAPKETYGISATTDGTLFSSRVTIGTIVKPLGKDWADLVGNFNGFIWSAPNGLVNVDDVSAMLKFITLKPAPHITVVDLAGSAPGYVNFLINATDLGLVLKGFKGERFPPVADVLDGYPANGDVTQCP